MWCLLGYIACGANKNRFFYFDGIPENHVFVTKWVPIKDLGLLIPANCTDSRDGHNGVIPRPQNPQIHVRNVKSRCDLGQVSHPVGQLCSHEPDGHPTNAHNTDQTCKQGPYSSILWGHVDPKSDHNTFLIPVPKPGWRGLQHDEDFGCSLKNTDFVR